jgi:hypothetical protein
MGEQPKWAQALGTVLGLALVGWIGWDTFTDSGVPGWLNRGQAWILGGSYYPQLTFVLTFLIYLIPVAVVVGLVALFRNLMGWGRYTPKFEPPAELLPPEASPPPKGREQ